ncbi:putative hydroxymethylglutaryl-CoA synthase [Helianthus annuus]|nr:putative hydroxymethylglutaryl-CoA synthase [Helianthus annuus]
MAPQNVGILAMEIYFPPTCIQQVLILCFDDLSICLVVISYGLDLFRFLGLNRWYGERNDDEICFVVGEFIVCVWI